MTHLKTCGKIKTILPSPFTRMGDNHNLDVPFPQLILLIIYNPY
jgi:hypothetical protein